MLVTLLQAAPEPALTPTETSQVSTIALITAIGTAAGIVLGAITQAVLSYLKVKYSAGKDYELAMMEAEEKLLARQNEGKKLDVNEITKAYEAAITEAVGEKDLEIRTLQTQITMLATKVDECSASHLECIKESQFFRGQLEAMKTTIENTSAKVEVLRSLQNPGNSGVIG